MDNQFLEEIDEINYTIEFLVDQLHEALEAGDYLEGEALAEEDPSTNRSDSMIHSLFSIPIAHYEIENWRTNKERIMNALPEFGQEHIESTWRAVY